MKIISKTFITAVFIIVSFICCKAQNSGFVEPVYIGPYTEVDGNFYIRVFVSYIDANNNWTNSTDLNKRCFKLVCWRIAQRIVFPQIPIRYPEPCFFKIRNLPLINKSRADMMRHVGSSH